MKKPELTATSVEKFLIEKFDSVSDLMQLSEVEVSSFVDEFFTKLDAPKEGVPT